VYLYLWLRVRTAAFMCAIGCVNRLPMVSCIGACMLAYG